MNSSLFAKLGNQSLPLNRWPVVAAYLPIFLGIDAVLKPTAERVFPSPTVLGVHPSGHGASWNAALFGTWFDANLHASGWLADHLSCCFPIRRYRALLWETKRAAFMKQKTREFQ